MSRSVDTPRPLVHVGYQKTASTFLQRNVFSDERRFTVPWRRRPGLAIENFLLAHPCRFDPDGIREEVEAKDQRQPVISHEDLLGYPIFGRYYTESAVRRIARTFPDAKILVCIREQRSMILSNYFQYVRQGGARDLSDMLGAGRKPRPGFRPVLRLDHFEYDLTYRVLRDFFEASQILMLPMELLHGADDEFLKKIYDFLDIDAPATPPRTVVHKRRTDVGLRTERFLNRLLPDPPSRPARYKDYPVRVRARTRIVKTVDRVSDRFGWGGAEERRLQDVIDEHVGDYFDASNARLAEFIGMDLKRLGYRVE